MAVLVYAHTDQGVYKKSTLEALSYGRRLSDLLKMEMIAVTIDAFNPDSLFIYGVNRVLIVTKDGIGTFNAKKYAGMIVEASCKVSAKVVILGSGDHSRYLLPLVAGGLETGCVSNVIGIPISIIPFIVKRKVFSGKVFSSVSISSDCKVIGLSRNSFEVRETPVEGPSEIFDPQFVDSSISSVSVEKRNNKITIADADIVISGGRGLKSSENFKMIEDLAEVLSAATACTRPVSDMGWRPHSEHVGQTGKSVEANLYVAIGISGAIQHLAGISASKVKVVINSDIEAPFFKFANYGIVGDAFKVVPELIQKLIEFKLEEN